MERLAPILATPDHAEAQPGFRAGFGSDTGPQHTRDRRDEWLQRLVCSIILRCALTFLLYVSVSKALSNGHLLLNAVFLENESNPPRTSRRPIATQNRFPKALT